jgi:hypothetical protein
MQEKMLADWTMNPKARPSQSHPLPSNRRYMPADVT